MKKIRAWHFVKDDRTLSNQPSMIVAPGYIYSENGPIVICKSGLHGSRRVIDALSYAPGAYLCLVNMWGDVTEQSDKIVARHRHVIAAANVSRELMLWACWCVRQVWHLLTDDRSKRAVEVAEAYAHGEATINQLTAAVAAASAAAWSAARDAAWDVAGAAAWSVAGAAARDAAWAAAWAAAGDAAGAAAWSAARDAAWSAARDAAWAAAGDAAGDAASAAAWSAAWAKQSEELERRIMAVVWMVER